MHLWLKFVIVIFWGEIYFIIFRKFGIKQRVNSLIFLCWFKDGLSGSALCCSYWMTPTPSPRAYSVCGVCGFPHWPLSGVIHANRAVLPLRACWGRGLPRQYSHKRAFINESSVSPQQHPNCYCQLNRPLLWEQQPVEMSKDSWLAELCPMRVNSWVTFAAEKEKNRECDQLIKMQNHCMALVLC